MPPQAVHAVHEVGYSSSAGDEVRSAGGSAGISVIGTAPGEVAYIWVLSAASMRNKHYPKGIMLDFGAAVSVSCGLFPGVWHPVGQARRVAGGRGISSRALRF